MQNLSISLLVHLFREGSAEISTGLVESFARELRRESAFEHDERDAEVVFGLTQSVFNSRQFLSAGFNQDAPSAIFKLFVRPGQVDHEVLVSVTETNHRCCGEHVEDHLLRGAGFEARGTGQHFRTDIGGNGNFRGADQRRIAICGNTDGESALLVGVFDGREHVRSRATGGEADENVVLREMKVAQVAASLRAIVFRAFHRIPNRLGATSNERSDEAGRDPEGGRAFGGVEDAKTAARASADVEKAATMADAVDDAVDGTRNGGKLAADGRRYAAVF